MHAHVAPMSETTAHTQRRLRERFYNIVQPLKAVVLDQCCNNPLRLSDVLDDDVLRAVDATMLQFPDDQQLQEDACSVLATLTSSYYCERTVESNGGLTGDVPFIQHVGMSELGVDHLLRSTNNGHAVLLALEAFPDSKQIQALAWIKVCMCSGNRPQRAAACSSVQPLIGCTAELHTCIVSTRLEWRHHNRHGTCVLASAALSHYHSPSTQACIHGRPRELS